MNDLMTFQYETNEVRTIVIDGEPWFVGKDVAVALGYERPTKAVLDHVDKEDKGAVPIQDSIGRMQNTPVINESGLYILILSSKLPSAKKFKRWVTSEVLPAIRKTGAYTNPQAEPFDPQAAYTGAQQLGDVVELAKLMMKLMKDNKRRPADILQTVGEQLEHFGVSMPDGFYWGTFSTEAAAGRSNTVAAFLEEYGDVTDKSVGDVYGAYLDYCRRTGNSPINITYAFGAEIVKQTGIHTKSRRQNGKPVRVYTR